MAPTALIPRVSGVAGFLLTGGWVVVAIIRGLTHDQGHGYVKFPPLVRFARRGGHPPGR